MSKLQVQIASGDPLDVRQFSVNERMSSIFQVDVVALSTNPSIEFEDVVGQPAMFAVNYGEGVRFWRGICSDIQLVQVATERAGLLDVAKAVAGAVGQGKAAKEAVEDAIDAAKNPGQLVDGPFGPLEAVAKVGSIAARVGGAVTAAMDLKSVLSSAQANAAHTYHLSIVPELWFTTQKRNYKIFQQMSELDIALELLDQHWDIKPELRLQGTYRKRKYRVQYGESDYAFLCRLLEDAGITFFFEQDDSAENPALWENKLIFNDTPQAAQPREPRIPFLEDPGNRRGKPHVTSVRIGRQVRPGRYIMQDLDYRRPADQRINGEAETKDGADPEKRLERFHYRPGAFLYGVDQPASTPVADDRGVTRTDTDEARLLAERRLDAKRASALLVTLETNAHDLAPGAVMGMLDHPNAKLDDKALLLVIDSSFSGSHQGEWSHHLEARSAAATYRPPLITPKPRTQGIESATVVGPAGEEIHVDEMGRVRVHFHWDRDTTGDETSSCWIPVSQPWGGAGYGSSSLPRIGQEVIIDFLGADPDRPVIIGRVYTGLQRTPYNLPEDKTKSGWKSNSSPGGGGFNEISFDDKKGKELVYMQAEKNLRRLVKNNESVNVLNNRTHTVGCNDTLTVGLNRTETVGINETITVGVNRVVTVGGSATNSVSGGQNITIGGCPPPDSGESKEPEGGKMKLNVENQFELTCGASKLTLDKSGKVTIQGTEFEFTSSGPVAVKGSIIDLN